MNSENANSRWQFSLRSFLFAVLVVGPIAGVVGPIVLESITAWKPPPRRMLPQQTTRSAAASVEAESYYESGETPLY